MFSRICPGLKNKYESGRKKNAVRQGGRLMKHENALGLDRQGLELLRAIIAKLPEVVTGISTERKQLLIESPDLLSVLLKLALIQDTRHRPRIPELTDLFAGVGKQIEKAKLWNFEYGWGFTCEEFEALGKPPSYAHATWSLDISLDTVAQTFMEACRVLKVCYPDLHIYDYIQPEHIRLMPGITHKRGLR